MTIYAHPQICQPSQSDPPKALNFLANHLPDIAIADQPSLWYPVRGAVRHTGRLGLHQTNQFSRPLSLSAEQKIQDSSGVFSTVLVVRAPKHTHNMHAVLTAAMEAASSHHLTTREALSGIWGSISLCAWIFLLVSFLPASRPTWRLLVLCLLEQLLCRGTHMALDTAVIEVAQGVGSCSYPCRPPATCCELI